MGRPKGGKNRKYTKEEKYLIIEPILKHEVSRESIAVKTNISRSVLKQWIDKYESGGLNALENTWKGGNKGNPFAALHTSKSLTAEERLRLENLRLKVENERLKKGYLVKGVGANKEFVTLKDANTK